MSKIGSAGKCSGGGNIKSCPFSTVAGGLVSKIIDSARLLHLLRRLNPETKFCSRFSIRCSLEKLRNYLSDAGRLVLQMQSGSSSAHDSTNTDQKSSTAALGIVQVPLRDWDLLTPYSQVLPIQELTMGSLVGLCHVRMETHFQCQQSTRPQPTAARRLLSPTLQADAPGFLPSAEVPMLPSMPMHEMPDGRDAATAPAPWHLAPLCQPSSPKNDAQDQRSCRGHVPEPGRASSHEPHPDGMPAAEPFNGPSSSAPTGHEGQLQGQPIQDLPAAKDSAVLGDQHEGTAANCGLFSFLAANTSRWAAHCCPPVQLVDMHREPERQKASC